MEPLTDYERKFATENHNLVYGFLHKYGYSVEIYYDVAIFGFLKAAQVYNRRADLRNKYDFPYISWQYIRSEIGNYFRTENARKRKPFEAVASLDAECLEKENLYNCVGVVGKSPEMEVLESERMTEFFKGLSDIQRKIAEMKINGYNNKEIYLSLEMKPSTYYGEVQRLKRALTEMTG